ncbi:MAG TPA: hypothetical protein PLW24_25410 [Burkholderiaceae bacterium]|nr:hypothetical protein [Burkholderiaceae bacterium]
MKFGDSNTHKPRAVDPAQFRAQATGIGQTLAASRTTGQARAQRVASGAPAPGNPVYQTKVNGGC